MEIVFNKGEGGEDLRVTSIELVEVINDRFPVSPTLLFKAFVGLQLNEYEGSDVILKFLFSESR